MKLLIKDSYDELSYFSASFIAERINSCQKEFFILGLPTGSTPLLTYKNLIKMYEESLVSFERVITFNMDEYCGLDAKNHKSYSYFMYENFFKFIDIKAENINLLNGMNDNKDLECSKYEEKIKNLGGVDLFLGGIGRNGHLAFNEPCSSFDSLTREVKLAEQTIKDNSRFFGKNEKQPTSALTVGLKTIFEARELIILASGKSKSLIVKNLVEIEQASIKLPASILKKHPNATLACDKEAAQLI